MTTQNRPSLQRAHTRKSGEKRDAELDSGVRIKLDDEVFEVRIGDLTPKLTRELRKNMGMSFQRLMETAADDPDIDVVAAFVWLARRIAGEDVDFDDVVFGYEQLNSDGFEIGEASPAAEDAGDDPEA